MGNKKITNDMEKIEQSQDESVVKTRKKILTSKDKVFLTVQGVLLLICAVMMIVAGAVTRSTAKSEQWARTVSRSISSFFGKITNAFSFSIFETVCIILVLIAIILIVLAIVFLCKRKIKKGLFLFINLVIMVIVFASFYIFTVSPCYYREPLDIPQYAGEIDRKGILNFADKYIEKLNSIADEVYRENGLLVNPYSQEEWQELLNQSCAKVDTDYYSDHTSRIKYITNSTIMSKVYIEGITFQPLGEANINKRIKTISQVMTSLHEICHAKGVMRESDCNLYSYYVAMSSDNAYIQYCGYAKNLNTVLSLVSAVSQKPANAQGDKDAIEGGVKETVYSQYFYKVDPRVRDDLNEDGKVWADVGISIFSRIGGFFNDIYLKLNGQKDGTGSYNIGFDTIQPPKQEVDEEGFIVVQVNLSQKERLLIQLINNLN